MAVQEYENGAYRLICDFCDAFIREGEAYRMGDLHVCEECLDTEEAEEYSFATGEEPERIEG